jgi:hypothetical protein
MMMRPLRFMGVLLLAGLTLSVAYNLVGHQSKAAALHGSVILSTGEWTSSGGATGMAIPTSVNTAAEFKTFINGLLHNTAESGDPGSDYNKYGAAFIVENMIHGKTEYNANAALVTAALNDYNKWAGYIDDYSGAGRIQWAVSRAVPAGQFNSTHLCVEGSGGYCWARATYYNNNYNGGGYDGHHFDFYTLSDAEDSTLMIFTNPNGTTFQIRRECGNVIGSAGPLAELGWNLNGRTTLSDSTVYTGQSATFTSQLQNTGASIANSGWMTQYCYTDTTCSTYSNLSGGTDSSIAKGGAWETEHTYTWVAAPSITSSKFCVRIIYTNGSGPGTATEFGAPVCVTIVPLQSTCNGANASPTLLGTTDSYTVNASLNTSGGKPGAQYITDNSNFYINVTGPSVNNANSNVPTTVGGSSADSGTGTLAASQSFPSTGDAGNYTISYGITGPVGAVSCTDSFTVAYRPYVSVTGGDISAGSGFGASCSSANATINSWNTNTTTAPNYSGAGSQVLAWASGNITNFVSGVGLSGGAASGNGYGLSLSNTVNTGGAAHGGQFGANAVPCMYDYYGNKPAGAPTLPVTTTGRMFDLTAPGNSADIPSGSYIAGLDGSGTFTVGNGSAQPITVRQDASGGNGKQVDVYVDGNLYIKNNIIYNYSSLYTLPRLAFYVRGNIYIDPGVTELHGVFIAQKISGTTGGYIYTCEPGVTTAARSYNDCKKQLKVVGSMDAENGLRLQRTWGNLTAASGVPAEPAEIFQYSPEMWLAQTPGGDFNYQAYTNLNPVL